MPGPVPSSQSPAPEYNPIALEDVLHFLKTNYTALAVGAAIIVLVAAGLATYFMQQRRNAERASQMLLVAQSPKQWEELLAQHPNTAVAPIAMLALASSQYGAGAYDQALATTVVFWKNIPGTKWPRRPNSVRSSARKAGAKSRWPSTAMPCLLACIPIISW